jgi:hypothetical protein
MGVDENAFRKFVTYGYVRLPSSDGSALAGNVSDFDAPLLQSAQDAKHATRILSELRWLAVVSPDSWAKLMAEGLSFTLLGHRYDNVARLIAAGQRIAFYMTGGSEFCGIASVKSIVQNKRTVWPNGAYAYRIPLDPIYHVEPKQGVRAKSMLDSLDFVTSKTQWAQYFRTTMRLVSSKDYQSIEHALLHEQRLRISAGK